MKTECRIFALLAGCSCFAVAIVYGGVDLGIEDGTGRGGRHRRADPVRRPARLIVRRLLLVRLPPHRPAAGGPAGRRDRRGRRRARLLQPGQLLAVRHRAGRRRSPGSGLAFWQYWLIGDRPRRRSCSPPAGCCSSTTRAATPRRPSSALAGLRCRPGSGGRARRDLGPGAGPAGRGPPPRNSVRRRARAAGAPALRGARPARVLGRGGDLAAHRRRGRAGRRPAGTGRGPDPDQDLDLARHVASAARRGPADVGGRARHPQLPPSQVLVRLPRRHRGGHGRARGDGAGGAHRDADDAGGAGGRGGRAGRPAAAGRAAAVGVGCGAQADGGPRAARVRPAGRAERDVRGAGGLAGGVGSRSRRSRRWPIWSGRSSTRTGRSGWTS